MLSYSSSPKSLSKILIQGRLQRHLTTCTQAPMNPLNKKPHVWMILSLQHVIPAIWLAKKTSSNHSFSRLVSNRLSSLRARFYAASHLPFRLFAPQQGLKDSTVVEGEKLCLECMVDGYPTPDINWLHNDTQITASKNVHTASSSVGVCRLVIEIVAKDSAGKYVCVASNPAGSISTSCHLRVTASCDA